MDFIKEHIDEYAEQHTNEENSLLKKIDRETHLEVLQPVMLSGHYQGRLLSLISKLLRPRRILEIGTYTGYSALCFAEGLAPDGILHTIDVNEELKPRVEGYFAESDYSKQIKFHSGEALKIVPGLNEKWDLVFIDADKVNYSNYFNLVIESMNPGGIIMADNVLWSGKVTEEVIEDERSQALDDYNKLTFKDPRVENVLLPIRDGIMVSRKL
jgi:caffeoyl-CoA O-methyltransferase